MLHGDPNLDSLNLRKSGLITAIGFEFLGRFTAQYGKETEEISILGLILSHSRDTARRYRVVEVIWLRASEP